MLFQHPDYFFNETTGVYTHDVAVLEVLRAMDVLPVSLDTSESSEDCWISGWGATAGIHTHNPNRIHHFLSPQYHYCILR